MRNSKAMMRNGGTMMRNDGVDPGRKRAAIVGGGVCKFAFPPRTPSAWSNP